MVVVRRSATMTDTDDDIVWETQPCSWRDIANSGYLPQVVKLRPSAGRAAAPQLGGGIDANQPLVAYSRRVRTKVYAESLVWKESKGRFVVSGKPLEIPKDYAGRVRHTRGRGRSQWLRTLRNQTSIRVAYFAR